MGAGQSRPSSPRSWPRPRSCRSRWPPSSWSAPHFVDPTARRRRAPRRSSPPGKALQGARDHQAGRRRRRHGRRPAAAELRRDGRRRASEHALDDRQRRRSPATASAAPARRAADCIRLAARAAACRCCRPPSGSSRPGLGWIEARLLPPPSTVAAHAGRAVAAPATSRGTSRPRSGAWPPASAWASCWRRVLGALTGFSARARQLLDPDAAGAAGDPLDRLGAAVHPLVRHLRGLQGGADRDRRVLPDLSRR